MINRIRSAWSEVTVFLRGVDQTFLPIAVYVTSALFWPFTPLGDTVLKSFDRRIGLGIVNGYDSAAAYQNLMSYLVGMVLLFSVLLCFFHWYGKCQFGKWLEEANQIAGYLIWPMLVDYVNIFAREEETVECCPLFAKAFLLMLFWEIVLHSTVKKLSIVSEQTAILQKVCGSIAAALVCGYFLDVGNPILWTAVYSVVYLILSVLKNTYFSHLELYIVWLPAVMTLCVEGFYILNQWEIYVVKQRKAGALLLALMVAGCFFLCRRWSFGNYSEHRRELILCSGLLTSMILVAYRPPLEKVMHLSNGKNLFELSNEVHMADGLINWGKIPLIETFSAHSLSDMVPNLVWKILNGPAASVVGTYTAWFCTLGAVLLWAVFSRYMRPFVAFVVLALSNVVARGGVCFSWKFAPITILLLFLVIKRPTLPSYLIYWSGLAVVLLYQLDYGLMFGLGSLITFLLLVVLKKIPINAKKFWGAGATVTAVGMVIALLICLAKGISPFARAREFLDVSLGSNPIWAYYSIGDPTNGAMFWAYIATPLAALGILLWMLWALVKGRNVSIARWAGIMVLLIGVLINLNRTMVRHSILEGVDVISRGGIIFAVALLLYELKGRKAWVFLSVSMLTVTIVQPLTQGYLVSNALYKNVVNNAQYSAENMLLPIEQAPEKVERIVVDSGQEVEQVKAFMDLLLEDDESYVDFSNQSALYALIGRESPFYVSEVPGLLSGEYSQQCYIEQIEQQADKLPLLLTAGDISKELNFDVDGVALNVRYYKIIEYLCNHYQPLLKWNNYAIWVRIEQYESALEKLNQAGEQIPVEYTLCDYTNSTFQPTYAYQDLALIWAELDEKNAVENPVLMDCAKNENGYYDVRLEKEYKKQGNYLKISVQSEVDTEAELLLFNAKTEMLCRFTLNVSQGDHEYLIRISNYPGWYSDQVCWAKMGTSEPVSITGMQVLQGD